MSDAVVIERVTQLMDDVKKTLVKVECLRGTIGNLGKVGIPNGDPTNIKPFIEYHICPKVEGIANDLRSLMYKLDKIYVPVASQQKYQNLINEIEKALKRHKEKYGES